MMFLFPSHSQKISPCFFPLNSSNQPPREKSPGFRICTSQLFFVPQDSFLGQKVVIFELKTIEPFPIKIKNGVLLSFDPAPLRWRIAAAMLDILFMGIFIIVFKILSPFGLLALFCTYFSLNEIIFKGKTPGKWLVKIRTIHISGKVPLPADFIIRSIFHLLDTFLTFGTLGLVFHYYNPHGRRLGDLVGNTLVIRDPVSIPEENLKPEILKLTPEMEKILLSFSEDQWMIVREIIDRNHRELIEETAEKMASKLGFDSLDIDEKEFLKELIRHYVTLKIVYCQNN
jgi:uncharacterized RDD family membrane protein YckC